MKVHELAPLADTLKGKLDRAILAILLHHDLRRSELCALRVKDLAERRGLLSFMVRGKRGTLADLLRGRFFIGLRFGPIFLGQRVRDTALTECVFDVGFPDCAAVTADNSVQNERHV